MKNIIFLSIFFIGYLSVFSQNAEEKPSVFEIKADIMSRYIWRGCDIGGESPNIQPSVLVNLGDTNHAVTIGAWAAYNFGTSNQEADLYVTYTFKKFLNISLYDYYFPGNPVYSSTQKKYFNYQEGKTGHIYEVSASFNGTDKIPFTLLFAMNVYGDDKRKTKAIINDTVVRGNIFYTKYIELGYKKTIRGTDFNAFIGATLDDPNEDKQEEGYYYNKSAGIINIGCKVAKTVKITDSYSLPLQGSLIFNPEAEKIYVVFGISF